jgi:hypothetical protein
MISDAVPDTLGLLRDTILPEQSSLPPRAEPLPSRPARSRIGDLRRSLERFVPQFAIQLKALAQLASLQGSGLARLGLLCKVYVQSIAGPVLGGLASYIPSCQW